jgi:hypothetical protein
MARLITRARIQTQSDAAKIILLKLKYQWAYPQVALAFRGWTHKDLLRILTQHDVLVPRIASRCKDAALCLICAHWPAARSWGTGAGDQRDVPPAAEQGVSDAPPGQRQTVNDNEGPILGSFNPEEVHDLFDGPFSFMWN